METFVKYLQIAISSGSTLFVLVPIKSRKGQYCHVFCKRIYKINKTVIVCCFCVEVNIGPVKQNLSA